MPRSGSTDGGLALRPGGTSADGCSELDPLRDEAIDYAVRLMRAGVATEPHVFPGTCHGFDAFLPEWDTSLQSYAIQGAAVMRAFMHNHS